MNDKDRQELDTLKTQLTMLQVKAHACDHELMLLRVHSYEQDARLKRLMALVGLFKEDLERPDALTPADKSMLLRVRRVDN